MLLGLNNLGIFSMVVDWKDSLALWSSQLGTGWMIAGRSQPGCECQHSECTASVNGVSVQRFQPPWILSGSGYPSQMRSLPKLQGMKVQADCISIKESKVYEVIVNRLKLDVDKRKWTASYLVFV
jgi:hypothetical protein